MMKVIFCVLALLHVAAGVDYCALFSKHIMCIWPEGPAALCGDHGYNTISQADITLLLDEHNKYRSTVATGKAKGLNGVLQPQASDMLQLEWDTELATIAQRWVDQCKRGHPCHNYEPCMKTERYDDLGQNFAGDSLYTKDDAVDFKAPLGRWYGEVAKFDKAYIKPFVYGEWGHYSQVVWAKSQYIGCGVETFKSGGWWWRHLVCNYGPAANLPGSQIYEQGDACTACPSGTACSSVYPGLCKKSKYIVS